MIRIYTTPGSTSCRKAKAWFKEHNISFIEKNIFSNTISTSEFKELLERSTQGTDEVISSRAKYILDHNIDLESMSINELVELVQKEPSILKRPIIVDERRFLVGFNEEEIRAFLPKEMRE